jgi:hypothetical protein
MLKTSGMREEIAMDRDLRVRLNEEVERYRRALIYYAKSCDWDTFKHKAGSLFDYLESIELSELERRFFRVFRMVLFVLIAATAFLLQLNHGYFPALVKYKTTFTAAAMAVSGFEFFFYIDFRVYVKAKLAASKKRREWFIRSIEQDFKSGNGTLAQN